LTTGFSISFTNSITFFKEKNLKIEKIDKKEKRKKKTKNV